MKATPLTDYHWIRVDGEKLEAGVRFNRQDAQVAIRANRRVEALRMSPRKMRLIHVTVYPRGTVAKLEARIRVLEAALVDVMNIKFAYLLADAREGK